MDPYEKIDTDQPERQSLNPRELKEDAKDSETEETVSENSGRCRCCCCRRGICCRCRKKSDEGKSGKSGKSCPVRFSQLCLIIPNTLFILAGLSVSGIGIWFWIDRECLLHMELLHHLPSAGPLVSFDRFPFVVIAVGCSISILSLVGCCGAWAQNACCLCLYAVILLLIIMTDVALIIVSFVLRDQAFLALGNSMQQRIMLDYNSTDFPKFRSSSSERTHSNYFTRSWDNIQDKFNCCGSFGPEDYETSEWFKQTREVMKDISVPASCCNLEKRSDIQFLLRKEVKECQREAYLYFYHRAEWEQSAVPPSEQQTSFLKTEGCHKSMFATSQQTLSIIIGVVCAVVVLQIIDVIFACVLLRYIRRRQDELWLDIDERVT